MKVDNGTQYPVQFYINSIQQQQQIIKIIIIKKEDNYCTIVTW